MTNRGIDFREPNWILQPLAAAERINKYLLRTPLRRSSWLSNEFAADVYLKLENFQVTGSFKARGALNALFSLDPAKRQRGVVTASSGNHGAAVAYAATQAGIPCVVFVPAKASLAKIEKIRGYGAELKIGGHDCIDAEARAREHAARQSVPYISPYNDLDVVLGQSTLGIEIAEQLPNIDTVVVAAGGGGLVCGIAGALKARCPRAKVWAASPESDCALKRSLDAGYSVTGGGGPTFSDGTSGDLEEDSVTFPLAASLIDDFTLVNEEAIKTSVRDIIAREHMLIEGAAGVPLAAVRALPQSARGKHIVLVLCGANIDAPLLRAVLGNAP